MMTTERRDSAGWLRQGRKKEEEEGGGRKEGR